MSPAMGYGFQGQGHTSRLLTSNGFAGCSRLIPLRVGLHASGRTTVPLRSSPITGPSSLLRAPPPPCPASVLWLLWCRPLELLPCTSGRQVLTFLTEAWSLFTPPSCRAPVEHISGSPRPSSRGTAPPPVTTPFKGISTRLQRFTFVRLQGPHLTQSRCAFSRNAHHQDSLPQQLAVVWSPLLTAGSGGPAPIFSKAPHSQLHPTLLSNMLSSMFVTHMRPNPIPLI